MSAIEVKVIPVNTIAAPSFVRVSNGHDKESLTQLANSIQTHGLLQPIVIRPATEDEHPAQWVTIAGRRRLAACKLAGMTDIPALITETDEARSYELEIAENIQREQMTLADTARAVRTLMTIYNNAKRVSEILNKSPAWVSKHLAITASNLPTEIADLLDRGIVADLETLILLKQIAQMPASHPDAARTLTRMMRIANDGNMNRQIAREALAKLKDPQPATAPATPAATVTTTSREVVQQRADGELNPATHFYAKLPIDLMNLVYEKGGDDWIVSLIKAHSES